MCPYALGKIGGHIQCLCGFQRAKSAKSRKHRLAMSLLFLPFRASAPIEQPISLSRIIAVSLLPASMARESAFPNDHFGADYRIQLLSLHLANLSSSYSS